MEFDLTPEITDEVIFAMEDQTGHFLYDSSECRCVATVERDDDDDRYYAIPVWDSISGFRMMDRFVAQLRNPVVREELRSALAAGHGVFRNFKNILKSHPEVERLWYQFKEREMRNIVRDWYNGLRDFWGLDRIGAEPEETGEIVSQDFTFRLFSGADEQDLVILLDSMEAELSDAFSGGLAESISDLWDRIRFDDPDSNGVECVFVAESGEGDIVGCAISSPLPSNSVLSVHLTVISVYPEFRGLGIGKELLARTIDYWSKKGYRWLLFTSPVVPQVFFPVLHRAGFVEKGHVSVLDLPAADCH